MGVSTSITPSQAWQSHSQQARQDFTSLGSALQAGDLSSAQQAYAALLQLQTPVASQGGCSFSSAFDTALDSLAASQSSAVAGSPGSNGQSSGSNPLSSIVGMLQQDLNELRQAVSSVSPSSIGNGMSSMLVVVIEGSGSGQAESLDSAMSTLEQDLQADNMGMAQQDFLQLQQALQAAQGQHHHPHHSYGNGGNFADIPSGSSLSTSS